MTGKQVLEYEELRSSLLKKASQIIKDKYNLYYSSNHHPSFKEEGIYFPCHDGLYMVGARLLTWEELGISNGKDETDKM
jgi:hypothetical protein